MIKNTLHTPKYRPDIDGLRAIAVLSVVIFHAFPSKLPGGFAGVDVFFVISGFLISTILFQEIDRGSFSISNFYSRRIRRIFPSLAIVLISVLIFGWLCLFPDELQQLGKHTASSVGFIQNFTLWKEVGYFDNASETKPLLHIWSLAIEEQFYFVWPLLLWGVSYLGRICGGGRHHTNRLYLLVTISVFLISFILNLKSVTIDPSKTFYLPQFRVFELALGAFLSWLVLYKPKTFPNWVKNILSFSGLLILLIIFRTFNKETIFPGKNALLPIFATAFIIWAGPNAWLNRKILSHKILVWIGLISFPLYLWHWPILSFGRILYGEMPPREFRLIAVVISILLSWLTVKIIEKPFRFGNAKIPLKIATLCLIVFGVGGVGFIGTNMDFEKSHAYQNLPIKRKGFEFGLGSSLWWYEGKNDWLFLGNADDKTVQKLVGAITPTEDEINNVNEPFLNLAKVGEKTNTKIVLIIGPNKSSIYPEYLPDEFVPSQKRYSRFFLDKLNDVPNLTVYDPTEELLELKTTEGILYWRTDTHWNNKGAFLVYSGFSTLLGLPIPEIELSHSGTHSGDLIRISKKKNFPLYPDDNWEMKYKSTPDWSEKEIQDGLNDDAVGKPVLVANQKPLSHKKIWVTGDSFMNAQKKYFNTTFKEIYYLGHWTHTLKNLSSDLEKAKEKPDMIVIVRVERKF